MSRVYVIVNLGCADVVVCQCRRCACNSQTRKELSPLVTRAEVKSSPKSCCSSRKKVRDKSDISPTINSQTEIEAEEDQVIKVQDIDIPAILISSIPVEKDPSTCCGS
jgi:hypothetical protein